MSNILIISQHYYPENFRISDIAEELVKRGHKVTVITGYPNYPQGEIYDGYNGKSGKKNHGDEIINGVHVLRCYEHPRKHSKIHLFLNYYSISLSMKRKVKKLKEKYDLVLINQLSPVMQSWAGIYYAKKHYVKSLLYCYDLWPDSLAAGGIKKDSLIYNYYYRVSNKIYKNVDEILVTSKNFINYFVDKHHIEKEKLFYLPQYCEDLFSNIKHNPSSTTFNYVFAGNVGNVQSVETIIKAADVVKDDPSIKIHIVGDGSALDNCKRLAVEYDLDNVSFYGKRPLDEMPEFYEKASAMLVTLSKNEVISNTLPGKVQSYMCAGKPIIAAADGETPIIIGEAKCGLCAKSEDYNQLAKLFEDFKNVDQIQLSNNARDYYNKHFRKELFFKTLEERMKK